MRQIILPATDLKVSRFVFGTASLHHLGNASAQAAHLELAAGSGFTHFDTAPLYGFGGAESMLGAVFGQDQGITITTKVGLYPPGGANQGRLTMLARKAGGKLWPTLSRAVVDLSVARARLSLEQSLRRLRRCDVDLLMLHDPAPDLLQTDEWQRWSEDEKDRVRYFGVAGPAARLQPILESEGPFAQVTQVRDGLGTREADVITSLGRPLQLTYGYFSTDVGELSGAEIVAGALERNRTGAILVYTSLSSRVTAFSDAAERERRSA